MKSEAMSVDVKFWNQMGVCVGRQGGLSFHTFTKRDMKSILSIVYLRESMESKVSDSMEASF